MLQFLSIYDFLIAGFMEFNSAWPFFVCMALVYFLASTPLFAIIDPPLAPQKTLRVSNIDGVRGFLAFGVFFGHATLYHEFLLGGVWGAGSTFFYSLLAQGAVSIFFMITGYLFWGRMIEHSGRPNWLHLYIGRVFRIGPLYLFAVLMMVLIVAVRTGFTLNVPLSELAVQILRWSTLGFFGGGPDINSYQHTGLLVAGVFWTLALEWKFYLSLLLISVATKSRVTHLPFSIAVFIVCIIKLLVKPSNGEATLTVCIALFAAGMVCASLEKLKLLLPVRLIVGSVLALGLLIVLGFTSEGTYSPLPIIILAAFFFLLVSGADIFGVLSSGPARRLGNVSYGIYILQGLVLTVILSNDATRNFALSSPIRHWIMVLICALLLFVISAATHLKIERTGMELGKRVARFLSAYMTKRFAAPG
jgi:peptidoglycan/LPS O-acetylase OafA/YrhL